MDWRIKGAIQRALEVAPFGDRLHAALHQRSGMRFDDECDLKVDDWRIMMDHLRAANVPVADATIVEIGTGWYPTFPFCLLLAGAGRVHTFDIVRNLNARLVRSLATRLRIHVETIARASGLPPHTIEARRRSLAEGLSRSPTLEAASDFVIDYRVADASRSGLPDASVDVVFSNSVLEHISVPVLQALFAEAMRILKPGGVAFHSVNCGDHYAYFDPSISQLNYLQFSDLEWQRWNNRFHYQNRLRAKEFIALAERAGFAIEIDSSQVHPQRLAELSSIHVDPAFAHYTREELALTNVDFLARKPL